MDGRSVIGACLGLCLAGCGGDAAAPRAALFGDLAGVVVDTHGSAVEDCHVFIEGLPQGAVCQTGGRFRIAHVAQGARFVTASRDGASGLLAAAAPVSIVGGATATVELSVPDPGSVFGRVQSAPGGAGRAALVLARGLPLATAPTADGWYLFPRVPYGLREIVAIGASSLTGTALVNVLGRTQADAITLAAATSAAHITGRLVDGASPDAAPPSARVTAAPLYAGTAAGTTSSADGRFDVALTAGYYWLAVAAAGRAAGQVLPVGVLAGETRDVGDIVLSSTDPGADLDGDGVPNGEDCDIDGDGYCNATPGCRGACRGTDDLPYNAWEHVDADRDGVGTMVDPSDRDATNMVPLAPSCGAGFADCDRDAANGCEVYTAGDPAHCGGCGVACAAGEACVRGACTSSMCGESGQGCCASDATHPLAFCASATLACCGGSCTDARSDPRNCGGCGVTCATGACAGGACAASSCGGDGQPCCGSGSACGSGLSCVSNRCSAVACSPVGVSCTGGAAPCCGGLSCRLGNAVTSTLCCQEAGGSCRSQGDCCGPMPCTSGRCACGAVSGPCATDADCCANLRCNGTCVEARPAGTACPNVGVCAPGLACRGAPTVCCAEVTGACASDPDCCGGMRCSGGRCAPRAVGESCAATVDCATGLTCRLSFCRSLPMNYVFTPGTATWVDACRAPGGVPALVGSGSAAWTSPITLPFTFTFEGTPFTQVILYPTGDMSFGATPVHYGTAYGRNPWAFVFHPINNDTLRFYPTGGVCYAVVGAAPSRRFVFETVDAWLDADPMQRFSFEAILNEADDSLDFVYQTVANPLDRRFVIGVLDNLTDTPTLSTFYSDGTRAPAAPPNPIATGTSLHVAPGPRP